MAEACQDKVLGLWLAPPRGMANFGICVRLSLEVYRCLFGGMRIADFENFASNGHITVTVKINDKWGCESKGLCREKMNCSEAIQLIPKGG